MEMMRNGIVILHGIVMKLMVSGSNIISPYVQDDWPVKCEVKEELFTKASNEDIS
jgi:hypothetical protein